MLSSASAGPVRSKTEIISIESEHSRGIDLNAKTPYYVSLRSAPRTDGAAPISRRDGLGRRDPPYHQGNAGLMNVQDMYYYTEITVGNKTVPVTIDTGSSDTWFVQSPFVCMDYFQRNIPVSRKDFFLLFSMRPPLKLEIDGQERNQNAALAQITSRTSHRAPSTIPSSVGRTLTGLMSAVTLASRMSLSVA